MLVATIINYVPNRLIGFLVQVGQNLTTFPQINNSRDAAQVEDDLDKIMDEDEDKEIHLQRLRP